MTLFHTSLKLNRLNGKHMPGGLRQNPDACEISTCKQEYFFNTIF